jgi:hypothetical protein
MRNTDQPGRRHRHEKSVSGEPALDQFIDHGVADRASDLFGQDDRGAQRAAVIAKLRQFDARAADGIQRADTVNGDLYAIDVDFDRGESEELAGAHRRDRQDSDRHEARLGLRLLHSAPGFRMMACGLCRSAELTNLKPGKTKNPMGEI